MSEFPPKGEPHPLKGMPAPSGKKSYAPDPKPVAKPKKSKK